MEGVSSFGWSEDKSGLVSEGDFAVSAGGSESSMSTAPLSCVWIQLLRDDRIAELKNRINRSRKIHSAKPNGHIVERSRSSGRSTDTRLLGQ